jgi:cytochrome c553
MRRPQKLTKTVSLRRLIEQKKTTLLDAFTGMCSPSNTLEAACHGDKGQGFPPFPALAGKREAEQLKALQDFKSGARSNPMMSAMAAALSDQDMEDLAAYFASFK